MMTISALNALRGGRGHDDMMTARSFFSGHHGVNPSASKRNPVLHDDMMKVQLLPRARAREVHPEGMICPFHKATFWTFIISSWKRVKDKILQGFKAMMKPEKSSCDHHIVMLSSWGMK